jgi:hypothetical protein
MSHRWVVSVCLLTSSIAHADAFWSHWGDGKAELAGYALTQPRYGEPRQGSAVLIFVTEDFSDSARVKADPGKHPKSDVYPVMKLNVVREFQTGIYDYELMSSTWVRPEVGWPLVKSSFSAQEWCGHVYQQWIARGGKLEGVLHSYFDGEGDAQPVLPYPAGGIVEETVPVRVRGLKEPWLAVGERLTVPFLPSAMRARLDHRAPAWGEATVTRPGETTYVVAERGGPTTTWTVDAAYPHAIQGWSSTSGESAKLLGSARLPYWELHGAGGEAQLKKLGLVPPGGKLPRPRP